MISEDVYLSHLRRMVRPDVMDQLLLDGDFNRDFRRPVDMKEVLALKWLKAKQKELNNQEVNFDDGDY